MFGGKDVASAVSGKIPTLYIREHAVTHNRMDMRMPVSELPEGLDIRHHSGNDIVPTENRLIDLTDQFVGKFRELSEEFAVETE